MQLTLFPEPRSIQIIGSNVCLTADIVFVGADAHPLELAAAELVADSLALARGCPVTVGPPGPPSPGFAVYVGAIAEGLTLPPDDQGYALNITTDGIHLCGTTPIGTWYAAQTLRQIITLAGSELPLLSIQDWPHMRYRGLYVECKWGPDLMTLEDWKSAVDACAALKLNVMGVGVYGCWVVQYDGQVTEFLMLPLPQITEAASPKTIRYYSPVVGAEQERTYLPEMFQHDFFGELVAYGRSRGVLIRPQFNSLGHNTLIPRLRPEVSARDYDGNPTSYGYCTSASETERLVFAIYDHVLDTYLLPNGVTSFHVGLDEVWDSIGVDPADPKRVVEPWCRCSRCREQTSEELFLDWMLRLCVHLKKRGVTQIAIWNDQLSRHMNLLNEQFVERLAAHGLSESVVIEWWWYSHQGAFSTIRPELGLKRWVVPMTGYYHWWPYQSYLQNIRAMLALGVSQGAEGTESYCTIDLAFDRNYRYQAEWSWNPTGATELESFRIKYARGLFGERWEIGLAAFAALDRVSEPGPLYTLTCSLMPYRYTYVAADQPYPRRYPREVLAALRANPVESRTRLAEIARHASEARIRFQELASAGPLAWEYAVESHRIEALASVFLALLDIEGLLLHRHAVVTQRAKGIARSALARYDAMMADLEATKAHYLKPQILRELTPLHDYLTRLLALLMAGTIAEDLLDIALPEA